MKKKLRSGYTTGACAAAAAKAATMLLLRAEAGKSASAKERKRVSTEVKDLRAYELTSLRTEDVEIPFPDGSRHTFRIQNSGLKIQDDTAIASASVIKDAGDDPDVTNGAEIVAEARIVRKCESSEARKQRTFELPNFRTSALVIMGGKGVGIVTKPGLPVPIGEPAINPVPRQMIRDAVMEAMYQNADVGANGRSPLLPVPGYVLEITISVPNGEELAKKTLNYRLGITGGISILGTTGIVKPVSSEAWMATITSSMDVARASGRQEIVLSAGRTSEKAHMKRYKLPGECYVLIGDYLEFSLKEAKKHGFGKIHLCAQWAKMVKIAMATPQTHVRFGAIDIKKAVEFLQGVGAYGNTPLHGYEFNTAREIFDFLRSKRFAGEGTSPLHDPKLFTDVCNAARKYSELITGGVPVSVYLVSYDGDIIAGSE